MSRYTEEQRALLQASMAARADALRQEIAAALHQPGEVDSIALANYLREIDDDAVADLESALDIAGLERDIGELRGLEAALVRVNSPALGECEECGGDIPFARLAAQLHATRCTACQSQLEKSHGETGRHTL